MRMRGIRMVVVGGGLRGLRRRRPCRRCSSSLVLCVWLKLLGPMTVAVDGGNEGRIGGVGANVSRMIRCVCEGV